MKYDGNIFCLFGRNQSLFLIVALATYSNHLFKIDLFYPAATVTSTVPSAVNSGQDLVISIIVAVRYHTGTVSFTTYRTILLLSKSCEASSSSNIHSMNFSTTVNESVCIKSITYVWDIHASCTKTFSYFLTKARKSCFKMCESEH